MSCITGKAVQWTQRQERRGPFVESGGMRTILEKYVCSASSAKETSARACVAARVLRAHEGGFHEGGFHTDEGRLCI